MTFGASAAASTTTTCRPCSRVRAAARDNYRFSALLTAIAESEPFRYSTVRAPTAISRRTRGGALSGEG